MPLRISDIAENPRGVRAGERYGVEVEAEGCDVRTAGELDWSQSFQRDWTYVEDGSLRNGGIEFVSRPLTRHSLRPAITHLWDYFRAGRMRGTVRTGIHIHASCLHLETADVYRILQHYALVEPVLMAFCGPEREENIYCIPWYRGTDEPAKIIRWLEEQDRFLLEREEHPCKYSALNVLPLRRYGTIEFRHAPTWTDEAPMQQWAEAVRAVWQTHETEYNVLERYRDLGPVGFYRSFLPPFMPDVPEQTFIDLDVEYVASLLVPPTPGMAHPSLTWGTPPMLNIDAPALPGNTLDEAFANVLRRRSVEEVRVADRASTTIRRIVPAPAPDLMQIIDEATTTMPGYDIPMPEVEPNDDEFTDDWDDDINIDEEEII